MTELEQGIRVISFGIDLTSSAWPSTYLRPDGPALDATGLSELLVLEDIASKWAWDHADINHESSDVRANEICDMVGGTGIGGFYAILFSLNMTIRQVIASHKILQTVMFSSEEWRKKDMDRCATMLSSILTRLFQESGLTIDLDGPFTSNNSLKCFVCVLNNINAGQVRALRNYRVRSSTSPQCTIREAIHATLADGSHLPAVSIQDEQFLNASFGYANPSYELIKELATAFPRGSKLACFINLGASHPGPLQITSGGPYEQHLKLLRDAEGVAQNLVALCSGLGPCFFRLSVTTELGLSSQSSAQDAIRIVKSLTMAYLQEQEISTNIDDAVNIINQRRGLVLLQRLGSLAAEDSKAKLNAQIEKVEVNIEHLQRAFDSTIHSSVRSWLSPIDQSAKFNTSIRSRSESTSIWLSDHPNSIAWRKQGGILWFHGGMGTGKTILISQVIESLRNQHGQGIVAYYYFEFTNPTTLSEEALFRSLVVQLSCADETTIRNLYTRHNHGSLQPQLKTLQESLCALVRSSVLPVFIIIDAVDELPEPQRKYLLATIFQLSPLTKEGLRILISSRDEVDIHHELVGIVDFDVAIEGRTVHHDITMFVNRELSASKWKLWPEDEVQMMRDALIRKADGMFRMAACQVEILQHAQTTEDVRRAYKFLPMTLSDTYNYILSTVPEHLRSRSRTLLAFLLAASEPISIIELSSMLAVDLGDPMDADNLPVYREQLKYHAPQNIIGLGKALFRQFLRDPSNKEDIVLQLSHSSIKEYLLQDSSYWFSSNDRLAHETTARACLALLIHAEDPVHSEQLSDLRYTSEHWFIHASSNNSPQMRSQQMTLYKLFPWKNLCLKKELSKLSNVLEPCGINIYASPLVYATAVRDERFIKAVSHSTWLENDLTDALWAAVITNAGAGIVGALIERGGDVNCCDKDGETLLCYAASCAAVDVVRFLVGNGADMRGHPFHKAAAAGSTETLQVFIDTGMDVDAPGMWNESALQVAAGHGKLGVVEYLLEQGADVNTHRGYSMPALHKAAARSFLGVVQFLLKHGADINANIKPWGTVLDIAMKNGSSPDAQTLVSFLIENGAMRAAT